MRLKVLVTYQSITGNTQKIAEAIFEEINVDKEIIPFKEIDTLSEYDFIFVGCPIVKFGAGEVTKKWMNKYLNGKRIGLFCTHGAPEFAPDVPSWIENLKTTAQDAGAEIVSFFHCQGELSQSVLDMMTKADDPHVRKLAGFGRDETIGQPDESRVEKAREYARLTIKLL
jgi:flavodoxin